MCVCVCACVLCLCARICVCVCVSCVCVHAYVCVCVHAYVCVLEKRVTEGMMVVGGRGGEELVFAHRHINVVTKLLHTYIITIISTLHILYICTHTHACTHTHRPTSHMHTHTGHMPLPPPPPPPHTIIPSVALFCQTLSAIVFPQRSLSFNLLYSHKDEN